MPEALYRNRRDWQESLRAAAADLDIDVIAVEKDYWVCQVLRGIAESERGQTVVFKGGTSLEKLRLTERFSEDIDALVLIPGDLSNKRYSEYLKAVVADAVVPGVHEGEALPPGGKRGSYHRAVWLQYRDAPVAGTSGLVDEGRILLELGESGGPHPEIRHDVTSLLGRQLAAAEFDVNAYEDLRPFPMRFLHPGRTLLEKLLRVEAYVTNPSSAKDPATEAKRIGRQYYDVWALLGSEMVLELLADRQQVEEILTDAAVISQAFTKSAVGRPAGGFASSLAYQPDGPLAAQLGEEHAEAMATLFYGRQPPSFEDVCQRIAEHSALL